MQKYGKLMETRLYELEHESKMRLLKTHPHTSERQGYEADKARQQKREAKEASPQGTRKTSTTAVEAALPDTKRLISLTDGLFNGLFNHGNRGTTTQQFGIRCAFYNMRSLNSCRTAVRFWGQITWN